MIDSAEIEVEGKREAFPIARAADLDVDSLDFAIGAFRQSVGQTEDDRVDDPSRVFPDHPASIRSLVRMARLCFAADNLITRRPPGRVPARHPRHLTPIAEIRGSG